MSEEAVLRTRPSSIAVAFRQRRESSKETGFSPSMRSALKTNWAKAQIPYLCCIRQLKQTAIRTQEVRGQSHSKQKMRESISRVHAISCVFWARKLSVVRTRCTVHRTLLAETPAVTLARICRFQLRLLTGRNVVSMLLKVFDDLFRDNLTLETSKCTLDRFVVVY